MDIEKLQKEMDKLVEEKIKYTIYETSPYKVEVGGIDVTEEGIQVLVYPSNDIALEGLSADPQDVKEVVEHFLPEDYPQLKGHKIEVEFYG